MVKAVTAFDDLNNFGQRFIAFENHSDFPGSIDLVSFPEGRASILYNGRVYDWYGREASLNPRIKRIVKPFGYSDHLEDALNHCHDRFIAELVTGEFAFVDLQYHAHRKIYDPDYTGTRYIITGGILDRAPYLDLKETDIIHDPQILASLGPT